MAVLKKLNNHCDFCKFCEKNKYNRWCTLHHLEIHKKDMVYLCIDFKQWKKK